MKVKYGNLNSIKIKVVLVIAMLIVVKASTETLPECNGYINNFYQKVWYKGYVPAVLNTTPGYHDIRLYFTTQEANMIDTSDKDARENLISFNRKYACDNKGTSANTNDDVFFPSYNFKYKDGQNSLYENLLEYIPNQYFRISKKSMARFFIWDIENEAVNQDEIITFKVSVFYTKSSAYSFIKKLFFIGDTPSFTNKPLPLLVCSSTKCCTFEISSLSTDGSTIPKYPEKIKGISTLYTFTTNPTSESQMTDQLWTCSP